MRMCSLLLSAAAAGGFLASGARACGPVPTGCRPPVVVLPAYTQEGLRVGTVEAVVRPPVALELSPYTGQPVTVVYNDPGRLPGSVDPGVALVPLPGTPRYHARAAHPRGD